MEEEDRQIPLWQPNYNPLLRKLRVLISTIHSSSQIILSAGALSAQASKSSYQVLKDRQPIIIKSPNPQVSEQKPQKPFVESSRQDWREFHYGLLYNRYIWRIKKAKYAKKIRDIQNLEEDLKGGPTIFLKRNKLIKIDFRKIMDKQIGHWIEPNKTEQLKPDNSNSKYRRYNLNRL